ncbi:MULTISPECIES: plasmid pRiA4b ORF-3 family protein [unclassified Dysgonomonas]|uniref:plasmid pRiA4b ORF-3 family protein n=1 Tax=unclassified Dysgonomonas TaxID=2630389 RepID=UPI0013ED6476|nr:MULTISPECIES: plasmid pRiA4b ORF-3 family protein [unclassified Dysgonomonas]
MVFRFLLLSDEVEDFRREIQIDADATFYDLHEAIIKSVGYKEGEMSSFFICSDTWEKEREITLVEMNTSSDEDSFTMKTSVLDYFLEDEKQKMMYVFDYMTERAFFMELREIITGKSLEKAVCTRSEGEPPAQFVDFDTLETEAVTIDTGENFYGDEGYDLDELDAEGFDGLDDGTDGAAPSEEEFI